MRRWIYISVILFFICITKFNGTKLNQIPNDRSKTIDVNISDLPSSLPLDLTDRISNVTYIPLSIKDPGDFHFDRITVANGMYYILDERKSRLLIFSHTGNLLRCLDSVSGYSLYKSKLFTYQLPAGTMRSYSSKIRLIKQIDLGFRGLDFAALSDTLFAFYTGGLITRDKRSTFNQIAYVNAKGKLLGFAIPISSAQQDIDYSSRHRLLSDGQTTYFIAPLSNELFALQTKKVVDILHFNFGHFTLTDSIFSTFKRVEDYSFFPYILNITSILKNKNCFIFSCIYRNEEAYFILNNNNKIIASGLSAVSKIGSGLNNFIPKGQSDGRYLTIVRGSDQNLLNTQSGKLAKMDKISSNNLILDSSKIYLTFYDLDLDSYKHKAIGDYQPNHRHKSPKTR